MNILVSCIVLYPFNVKTVNTNYSHTFLSYMKTAKVEGMCEGPQPHYCAPSSQAGQPWGRRHSDAFWLGFLRSCSLSQSPRKCCYRSLPPTRSVNTYTLRQGRQKHKGGGRESWSSVPHPISPRNRLDWCAHTVWASAKARGRWIVLEI